MSVTMTPILQKFLDSCKGIPEIISVTAEDPTDLMMAHVKGAFELSQLPVVIRFTIKDSEGNPQPVESVIPYEILNKIETPPVGDLVGAADRHRVIPADGVRFTHPDGSGSYPLAGHEWVEADIPELTGLLEKIKKLPNVCSVSIHNVVDPEIIANTGSDNAVMFIININNVTYLHINEKNHYDHDYAVFSVPKEVYLDETAHESIIDNAIDSIESILSKGTSC